MSRPVFKQPDKHYLEQELENLIQTDPRMFRFLREGSLDGIWYWDLENPDQEWMSPEMWRLFGLDPERQPHSPSAWQDLIFPEDLEVALDNFHKHCADPDHPYDQLVRYRHADGSTVWVRCRGLAIRDETGKPIRLLGAHNDLTQLKRAEEQYRDQISATAEANLIAIQAIEANKELQQFAYALSHDLKGPGNTLQLLMKELANYLDEGNIEDARAIIDIGLGTVTRMSSFIESLLHYTQLVNRPPVDENVDLQALAEEVLADLRSDIEENQAEVSVGMLPQVQGDRERLRVLLQNLVSNAIKYHREGTAPKVYIDRTTPDREGGIAFSVRDNGIGIDPKYYDRIFRMFQRLHTDDEYPGTGMGLSICQRIVSGHGGDIQVRSNAGKGSVFTVRLPGEQP